MKRLSMSHLATGFAALALPFLVLPAATFAQTSPPAAPAASQTMTAAPPAAAPDMTKLMSEKLERHIQLLHDQLGITAAEEPQWAQFAQVMRDNATQMEQAFKARGARMASMNAIDNMQSYAQLAQMHATNMQKLASAFRSLYAIFPAPQKMLADTVFRNNNGRTTPPKS